MVENHTHDSNQGLQRFLKDFRAGVDRRADDRRQGDRRSGGSPVDSDNRTGTDRRSSSDRRAQPDRRRGLTEKFSVEESSRIHQMVAEPDKVAECPRCNGNLLLGPLVKRDGENSRDVHCTWCRHSVVIEGLA